MAELVFATNGEYMNHIELPWTRQRITLLINRCSQLIRRITSCCGGLLEITESHLSATNGNIQIVLNDTDNSGPFNKARRTEDHLETTGEDLSELSPATKAASMTSFACEFPALSRAYELINPGTQHEDSTQIFATTIRFAHRTVLDYLNDRSWLGTNMFTIGDAHLLFAKSFIIYLSFMFRGGDRDSKRLLPHGPFTICFAVFEDIRTAEIEMQSPQVELLNMLNEVESLTAGPRWIEQAQYFCIPRRPFITTFWSLCAAHQLVLSTVQRLTKVERYTRSLDQPTLNNILHWLMCRLVDPDAFYTHDAGESFLIKSISNYYLFNEDELRLARVVIEQGADVNAPSPPTAPIPDRTPWQTFSLVITALVLQRSPGNQARPIIGRNESDEDKMAKARCGVELLLPLFLRHGVDTNGFRRQFLRFEGTGTRGSTACTIEIRFPVSLIIDLATQNKEYLDTDLAATECISINFDDLPIWYGEANQILWNILTTFWKKRPLFCSPDQEEYVQLLDALMSIRSSIAFRDTLIGPENSLGTIQEWFKHTYNWESAYSKPLS